jgi:hypothetical protein
MAITDGRQRWWVMGGALRFAHLCLAEESAGLAFFSRVSVCM